MKRFSLFISLTVFSGKKKQKKNPKIKPKVNLMIVMKHERNLLRKVEYYENTKRITQNEQRVKNGTKF